MRQYGHRKEASDDRKEGRSSRRHAHRRGTGKMKEAADLAGSAASVSQRENGGGRKASANWQAPVAQLDRAGVSEA